MDYRPVARVVHNHTNPKSRLVGFRLAPGQPQRLMYRLRTGVVTGHELVGRHFPQLRFFGCTLLGGGWATRAESTT